MVFDPAAVLADIHDKNTFICWLDLRALCEQACREAQRLGLETIRLTVQRNNAEELVRQVQAAANADPAKSAAIPDLVGSFAFLALTNDPDQKTGSRYNDGEYLILQQTPTTLYGVKPLGEYQGQERKAFALVGPQAYTVHSHYLDTVALEKFAADTERFATCKDNQAWDKSVYRRAEEVVRQVQHILKTLTPSKPVGLEKPLTPAEADDHARAGKRLCRVFGVGADSPEIRAARLAGYDGTPCPDCGRLTMASSGKEWRCDMCGANNVKTPAVMDKQTLRTSESFVVSTDSPCMPGAIALTPESLLMAAIREASRCNLSACFERSMTEDGHTHLRVDIEIPKESGESRSSEPANEAGKQRQEGKESA